MRDPSTLPPSNPAATPVSDAFRHALAATAGGDLQLIEGLRQIAWEAYVLAGLPYGLDEEGMVLWWEAQLGALSW